VKRDPLLTGGDIPARIGAADDQRTIRGVEGKVRRLPAVALLFIRIGCALRIVAEGLGVPELQIDRKVGIHSGRDLQPEDVRGVAIVGMGPVVPVIKLGIGTIRLHQDVVLAGQHHLSGVSRRCECHGEEQHEDQKRDPGSDAVLPIHVIHFDSLLIFLICSLLLVAGRHAQEPPASLFSGKSDHRLPVRHLLSLSDTQILYYFSYTCHFTLSEIRAAAGRFFYIKINIIKRIYYAVHSRSPCYCSKSMP